MQGCDHRNSLKTGTSPTNLRSHGRSARSPPRPRPHPPRSRNLKLKLQIQHAGAALTDPRTRPNGCICSAAKYSFDKAKEAAALFPLFDSFTLRQKIDSWLVFGGFSGDCGYDQLMDNEFLLGIFEHHQEAFQ